MTIICMHKHKVEGAYVEGNTIYAKEIQIEYVGKSVNPQRKSDRDRILSREVLQREFQLNQVTKAQLSNLRKREKPLFILKRNGKLFFAEIPEGMICNAKSIIGKEHQCVAAENGICSRFTAKSDEEGGCALLRAGYYNDQIEKFDFITDGFETRNTKMDSLIVASCVNKK